MTTRRLVLAAALVASLILLAFVATWQPGGRTQTGPTTGLKVVIVGVDGLDWFVMRGLLQDGSMPTTTTLLKRGLTGEIAADRPPLPQVGWTSLGRGRGLAEDELARVSGAGGGLHGVFPQLARLVDDSGGKSLTVGWPATWPAGSAEGLVVAPYSQSTLTHETGLPPAILGGDAMACPEAIRQRVDELARRNEEIYEEEFRRVIYDGDETDGVWGDHLAAARWGFLSDMTALDTAASMMADEDPDLTMVCLGGLDAVGHRFLAPAMPSFFADTPEEYERYADVLKNYYVFVDSSIERLRRLTDIDTVLIICSVYGFHPSLDVETVSGSHVNGPPGVLIVRGAGIPQRPKALSLTTADVAPTVLAILGVDIPTDMDGRVVQEALPAGLIQSSPPNFAGGMSPGGTEPSAEDLSSADTLVRERLAQIRGRMER